MVFYIRNMKDRMSGGIIMANGLEDAIQVHKTEVVFCDNVTDKSRPKHYRLNKENIKLVKFDYVEIKKFFGLKKELIERIVFQVNGEDIPEELIVTENDDPNFRRFRGGLRTFVDENKIPLEIYTADGSLQTQQ